jgi:hypothetical protein
MAAALDCFGHALQKTGSEFQPLESLGEAAHILQA